MRTGVRCGGLIEFRQSRGRETLIDFVTSGYKAYSARGEGLGWLRRARDVADRDAAVVPDRFHDEPDLIAVSVDASASRFFTRSAALWVAVRPTVISRS